MPNSDRRRISATAFTRPAILATAALIAVNGLAWLAVWAASGRYPFLIATGWLAYAFGLRHAVDADHIAAIDNMTRKLMREGKRPLGVGFFFSLGHSTIVILLCAAMATATAYVSRSLPAWKALGGEVGTWISGGFLYLIGLINLIVLVDLVMKARSTTPVDQAVSDDPQLPGPGLLVRILKPALKLVRTSGQMYWVGLLFGLGFDTASEVGLLALAARSGQTGVPFGVVMLLPLLFTAGMCLVDTLDGMMMLGAYGWALVKPARKLSYNLAITGISVLVAFVIGTHEILGMLNVHDLPRTRFWTMLDYNLGFVIVGVFVTAWGLAALLWKLRERGGSAEAVGEA